MVFSKIFHQFFTNDSILSKSIKVLIELIRLLGHCGQNDGLTELMNVLYLAIFSFCKILIRLLENLTTVNLTFDQLLINIDFFRFFNFFFTFIDLGGDFIFSSLENLRSLRLLNLFLCLPLFKTSNLDSVVEALQHIDLES